MFQKQTTKKTDRSNEQGFTIIEVMIAMVIFTFGILAVVNMQISSMQGNSAATRITSQSVAAQNKIEQLFVMSYDNPWLESAGNPPGIDTDGNTHRETTPQGYTVSWDVIDDTPVADSKQVTVTVTGRGGTSQVVSVITW